jgi:hypothetical protein
VVQASNGEERHGNVAVGSPAFDRANNVEQVDWLGIPSGQVRVTVRAYRVTQGPQTYALVVRMV